MKYVCLNIMIRYHFLNFNIQKKILSVYNKLIQKKEGENIQQENLLNK